MNDAATSARISPSPWPARESDSGRRRTLAAACLAHALHDGYTDSLYAFLPVWQSQFGLSYAGLALMRALYYATMGALQTPGDWLARPLSPRTALVLSTGLAAGGFAMMAAPAGLAGLCAGLVLAGIGSSLQHPRASLMVTQAYAPQSRDALGIYNFSGDLGKAALPATAAVLLPILTWRPVAGLMALLGVVVAVLLSKLAPADGLRHAWGEAAGHRPARSGFALLMTIGALDTSTRMAYLLFLPFLIHGRGGASATVGLALALLFSGGAFGKATCGWLGRRLGIVGGVIATEVLTALFILATLVLPLAPTLVLLPILGMVLNGTSSLLYGTVPDLAPGGNVGRGFALFYTGVIGSGGLAPVLYGGLADHAGRVAGVFAAAATAALIAPLALGLRRPLRDRPPA
jgi:MFS transporter, FSR family, fosmidomycin resistance protein